MRQNEVSKILEIAAGMDVDSLEIKEQLIVVEALEELAEKLKPIVTRNCDKLPEKSTFLFKM